MPATYFGIAAVVAIAAAIRGTWSPCGLSMLSSITPVAERGRGNRYAATATWFVLGAMLGGLTLGLGALAGAALFRTLDISPVTACSAAAVAAALGAWCDAGVLGRKPPFLHRQVNETWLRGFRSWVYGGGFGWQIGAGVTTYIMTAAVLVTAVVAALSCSPVGAVALCVLFGATRGSAVLLSARCDTPAKVAALHKRLESLDAPVRNLLIGVQGVGATAFVLAAWGPIAALAAAVVVVVPLELTLRIGARRAPA